MKLLTAYHAMIVVRSGGETWFLELSFDDWYSPDNIKTILRSRGLKRYKDLVDIVTNDCQSKFDDIFLGVKVTGDRRWNNDSFIITANASDLI